MATLAPKKYTHEMAMNYLGMTKNAFNIARNRKKLINKDEYTKEQLDDYLSTHRVIKKHSSHNKSKLKNGELDIRQFSEKIGTSYKNFFNLRRLTRIPNKETYTQKDVETYIEKYGYGGSKKSEQKKEIEPVVLEEGEFNRVQFAEEIGVAYKTLNWLYNSEKIERKAKYTQKDVDEYIKNWDPLELGRQRLKLKALPKTAFKIEKSSEDVKPKPTLELITPEIAKEMLAQNQTNRNINKKNLDSLISDMAQGNFHQTGESIKIAQNGRLLDGQHRLYAIIATKKPQEMLVVRGLHNDAFKFIDTGRTRKASDVLAIEGIENSTKIASAVKFIINFERGKYNAASNRSGDKASRITNSDVSKFVSRNKTALQESLKYGYNRDNKVISPSLLTSLHFVFNKIDVPSADVFCHSLVEGAGLDKKSPIYLLREKLIADIRATRKMRGIEKTALVCKAWNFFRDKITVSILKWDSLREEFPKPI